MTATPWQATACVLCSENCGIEVQVEGRRLARFKGDRRHPTGTDAFVFAAMLGTILEEGLANKTFIEERTVGFENVRSQLIDVPVDRYCDIAGVDPAVVRRVARGFAAVEGACVRSGLGLQQSRHSTLNLYLFGLRYTTETGDRTAHGPLINLLTASGDCDPLTMTPYHENVPVRIRRVSERSGASGEARA